tara:strand:- start:164 stop:373 length:210 start_codon:yes stop_codon:yes gene_type:complete
MVIRIPKSFDSKFRFILVAAERAKQLQNGAPGKVDLETRKPSYLAIREVEEELIDYQILEEEVKEEETE